MRCYQRAWRYACIQELSVIFLANLCGISVSLIYVSCFIVRWAGQRVDREDRLEKIRRVLVVGTGDAGNIILRRVINT